MGEKKILTEQMIEEKLASMARPEIRYIDPFKMAAWNLDTCCEMVDGVVSKKTLERAIEAGEIEAFKPGKENSVEPAKFLIWFKRHRKSAK